MGWDRAFPAQPTTRHPLQHTPRYYNDFHISNFQFLYNIFFFYIADLCTKWNVTWVQGVCQDICQKTILYPPPLPVRALHDCCHDSRNHCEAKLSLIEFFSCPHVEKIFLVSLNLPVQLPARLECEQSGRAEHLYGDWVILSLSSADIVSNLLSFVFRFFIVFIEVTQLQHTCVLWNRNIKV